MEKTLLLECRNPVLRDSLVRPSRQLTIVLVGLLIGIMLAPQIHRQESAPISQSDKTEDGSSARSGVDSTNYGHNLPAPAKTVYLRLLFSTCHDVRNGVSNETVCSVKLEHPSLSLSCVESYHFEVYWRHVTAQDLARAPVQDGIIAPALVFVGCEP